jgi:undecaprenyl-diphosphatase
MARTELSRPPAPARAQRLMLAFVAAGLGLVLLLRPFVADHGWLDVVVLGFVEGITEFLPISSTGHLLIVSELLGFEHSLGGTFEVFIQLGAVLAVIGYYARDLLRQAAAFGQDASVRRFWMNIVIAFVPIALAGLLLRDWIKTVLFDTPAVIGASLIVGGIVLLVVERLPHRAAVDELTEIRWRQALAIGFAQVCALVPGVSRSGSAIVGGLLGGLSRRAATTFSFYLAIPTLGLATIFDLLGSLELITAADAGRLLLGLVVSAVVAWISIDLLLRYVARNSFVAFGVYRILAGALILLLVAAGAL